METRKNTREAQLKGIFNVSCLSTTVFVAYVSYVAYIMHGVMNPMRHVVIEPGTRTIKPLWSEGTKMTATCYLAGTKNFHEKYLDRLRPESARVPLVGRAEGLTFDQGMTRHSFDLNVSAASAGADETWINVTMINDKDWTALMSNRTMYFHVLLEAEPPGEDQEGQEALWRMLGSVPLVKYGPRPKTRPLRKLLKSEGIGKEEEVEHTDRTGAAGLSGGSRATSAKGSYMSFWKPEVAVRIVADFTEYPHDYLPQTIQRAAEIVGLDRQGQWAGGGAWNKLAYKPIVHVDEIGLTSDKYVPLNRTLSSLTLRVTIEPMSLQRWQLMQTMEGSLQQQKESFGFQDSDVDDVRRLISDTNVYLLAVTLLVSTLHLLFEFLAFKSDVEFWRRNKSLRGLSVRTLFMEVVFQAIILLSLIEEDASLLVTVPAGVGVIIQIWKVRRATGMQLGWKGVVFTRLENAGGEAGKGDGVATARGVSDKASDAKSDYSATSRRPKGTKGLDHKAVGGAGASSGASSAGDGVVTTDQAEETMRYDRMAITYLSLLLLPLVVGFSVKKLVMDEHAGWYSWALQSLTAFVYTFGFVLMTPQLYINYKLKSVAHLPWRFLCYRSLNTVIDDLFAFVIRMPTMHRLSCFRDDVVFVIYIYQRWIYPVDSNRPQDRSG